MQAYIGIGRFAALAALTLALSSPAWSQDNPTSQRAAPAPPQTVETTEDRWSFDPRVRFDIDFGYIAAPNSTGGNSEFGGQARRLRLGGSGRLAGKFDYKIEANFTTSGDVSLVDAHASYSAGNLTFTVGQFRNYQGLEELTSTFNNSFIERAAFTDAFRFERRLGVGAEYQSGSVLVQAGVFADNNEDLSTGDTSVDARLVIAPKVGATQMHFGGSVHYNDLGEDRQVRYRQRPLVNWTRNRFIDTGNLAATSEVGIGLEAAAVSGPFHLSAEGFIQKVNRPGALSNPQFYGFAAEAGIFLTKGHSRGYEIGVFNQTRIDRPVTKGGTGAIQANLRFNHLNLNSAGIQGGKQNAIEASLIWSVRESGRLLLNYGLVSYGDAAFLTDEGARSYSVHAVAARAQFAF